MKFIAVVGAVCGLAAVVTASPGASKPCRRKQQPSSTASTCPTGVNPKCSRDNCLRAVIACDAAPGPAKGRADCSSFAQTTVTATPTPVTTTVTMTVAPRPLVCYQDNCVRAFESFSSSAEAFCATYTTTVNTGTYFPSFATNCPTAYSALSSGCSCLASLNAATATTQVTDTVFSTIEVTAFATQTAESVVTQTITKTALAKRIDDHAVPTYASACSGTARYSSACSCLGVSQTTHTVTATASTVTVTATAVGPRSPVSFSPQTTETFITTVTDYVTHTNVDTVTAVSVSTDTVTQTVARTNPTPSCNVFTLLSSGPTYAGAIVGNSPNQGSNMLFDGNYPDTFFSLTTSGQLLALNLSSTPACSIFPTDPQIKIGNPQYLDQQSYYEDPNYVPILCNGLGYDLQCTFNDGSPGVFGITQGGNQVIFTPVADVVNPINLVIVPQC